MNRELSPFTCLKSVACLAIACLLIGSGGTAQALTLVQFAPVQEVLTNEIAFLQANPGPKTTQRLRTLERANAVLEDTSGEDGRALRSLLSILRGKNYSDYALPLELTASNLLSRFNKGYQFAASLLPEMPPSPEADEAQRQFATLEPIVVKLNSADRAQKVAALLDPAWRRLNAVLEAISIGLTVPFPGDLSPNTIAARIDNVRFRSSAGLASENVFTAVVTESNIIVTINAIDGTASGNTGRRAISFSVTAQPGTFRYTIPEQANFTYTTGKYSENEVNHTATSGVIFVSANEDEVFGVFSATGEDFELTEGRFRIDLSGSPSAE